MSTKNIKFDDKKIKKSDFYKNKKIFQISDIMIMLLDHYVSDFRN